MLREEGGAGDDVDCSATDVYACVCLCGVFVISQAEAEGPSAVSFETGHEEMIVIDI